RRRPRLRNRSRRRSSVSVELPDEAKPTLVHGANEALVVTAVAERAPRRADAGAERRLGDDAAVPDHIDQLVLAHDPIAVLDQMDEQIEDLRLEMHDRSGAAQLPARKVDLELSEAKVQRLAPVHNASCLPRRVRL